MHTTQDEGFISRLTAWRRQLHRIPELEFELPRTRQFITGELEAMGYAPELHWGKSAVVARLEGKTGITLAFRADMDALTVTEATGVPFASEHPGAMHACGHDGHMAALLGLAWALKQQPEPPACSVLFIFQPAEEGPGGARLLVEEGLLAHHGVTAIIGTHLFPGLPQGTLGLKAGPFMAQNGEVDLVVTGRSAHGAQPQQGIDAVVAAADLVLRLQAVAARETSPLDPLVLTFGQISGGERCNIIARQVALHGTLRAFRDAVFRSAQESIRRHAAGTEAAFGCTVDVVFRDMYPAVDNDLQLTELMAGLAPADQLCWMEPQMLAEDFAFYQQKVPGLFYFMGTGNPDRGFTAPLHNAGFNFDESVLARIVDLNLKLLARFAGQGGQ